MADAELIQYGLAGVSAAIALKVIDLAQAVIKSKIESRGGGGDREEKSAADQALTQSQKNGDVIEVIKTSIQRLEKAVIDGNGQPGLVTQVAVLRSQLDDHVTDSILHGRRK